MIMIDDRTGSVELLPLFPAGIDVEVTRLVYGDISFLGNGPDGPVSIGIERKGILDLLSSMATGRLAGHQLIGLNSSYEYVYLIVEGLWRFNPSSGLLEMRKGGDWGAACLGQRRFMAREVVGFLNTLIVKAGVMILYTGGRNETVQVICALYHWWNDKQFDAHTSHLALHRKHAETVELTKPTLVRRIAAELPGIGWGKSRAVNAHFDTVHEMVMATERDWLAVPGIGKVLAKRIVAALRGEEEY